MGALSAFMMSSNKKEVIASLEDAHSSYLNTVKYEVFIACSNMSCGTEKSLWCQICCTRKMYQMTGPYKTL